MEKRNDNIPDHADKLLFAEDIVSYIMNNILDIFYEANGTKPYREVTFKAFNETVKEAVAYLYSKIEIVILSFLNTVDEVDTWDGVTYLHFVKSLEVLRFKEGLEARNFLCFCIEATVLANKFRNNGLLHAPDMAVQLIFLSLRKYDMFPGGWDALNNTASGCVKLSNRTIDLPTPESTPPNSSDSEIENTFSQSSSSDKHSDNKDPQKTVKYDDFSFNESKNLSKMHVPETEDTNVFIDDMKDQHIQLDDIGSFGKAERCGTKSQVVPLKRIFTAAKDMEGENLQVTSVSAKDDPSEFAFEFQGVIEDSENSVNCEKAVTNFHEVHSKCSFGINENLASGPNEKFRESAKKVNIESFVTFEKIEGNLTAEYNYMSIASTSYQSIRPSTSSNKTISMNNISETDLETVNNMQTTGQKEFPVSDNE